MKTNSNKWLLALLAVVLGFCLATGALFACNPDNPTPTPQPPKEEGSEKGAYALDDITLTLNGLGVFTLSQNDEVFSGTYTSDESGAFTLTFANTEDGTAKCTLDGDVLVYNKGTSEYRLYKQIKFAVTFNDGESTSVVNVTNGGFASKPADPEKAGYKFVGWYANSDFSGNPFSFDTEKITTDVTLYAKWIEYDKTAKEYTVSFNLGYDNATLAAQKTINGKLLSEQLPTPQRDGYTFKGWWVSALDQADKLTNQYQDGDTFTADTTLFALWQQDGTTLVTMDVNASGASWAGLTVAATLTVTKPDGSSDKYSIGASGSAAQAYDLSAKAAGEYKYTLAYGENTVERYYLNKALARVSNFSVVGNSVLLFDGVDNAETYYITVKCGNEAHNHTSVNIGKSTNYNFVNCSMKEGGIEFEVKAVAKNYYASTATFKFNRALDAVSEISYDATTGFLSWSAVANAQHYIVTVGETEYYLGTETKLDIKELPAGEVNVTVKAVTEGYNSAAATSAKVNKTDKAAPANLSVNNSIVTWDAVEGATSYRLLVGSKSATAETNEFKLDASYIALNKEYEIKVKAVFDNDVESLWSDVLLVNSFGVDTVISGLSYGNGVFSWTAALDAASYEYSVNGEKAETTTNTYATVSLTKAGINELQVRFLSTAGEYSEWATFEVYAYTLTFDSIGGSGASKQYKAVGDSVELPASERIGYDFAGWYNVAGGSQSNGAQFVAKTFDNPVDLVLYANWAPRSYTVTLDYQKYGTGEAKTATVTYTKSYTLPIPTMGTDEASAQKAFAGWYATADGKGTQFTDENGESLVAWNLTSDMTLYAKYVDAFTFTKDGDGYSVKASKGLGYYTKSIKIPATYKDLPVRSIAEYGFEDYYYLKTIELPDCLESIPSTAFDGCNRVEEYIVYATAEDGKLDENAIYSSVNGSILQTLYGQKTLFLIPSALTGTYTVPDGVTTIGANTFKKAKFEKVVIPSSVVSIEASAFTNCSALKTVEFKDAAAGETVQPLTIDPKAFNETSYVEKFVLPARVNEIENVQEFFSQFKLLSSIEVVGTYENQVYDSLTEKDGGKNIAGMLTNKEKDTIVYCPISINADSVEETFEVEVPSSIIEIADHAFDSFTDAKTAVLRKYNPVTKITFENVVLIGNYAFSKSSKLTEVVFKGTDKHAAVTIGDYAFNGCTNLETLTFEEEGSWANDEFTATKTSGVEKIGDYAFASTALQTLSLPNSLKTLGSHAFEKCSALATLDLSNVSPELKFGSYAFGNCRSLTEVELTKNVGEMEFNLVFYDCNKLVLTVAPDNPNYFADEKGVVYDRNVTKIIFYPDGYEGEYVIPDTVTSIGGAVFKGKSSMKAIVISANVTEIGDSAFEECRELTSVKIVADGENMKIGNKAFYNCTSLKSIELPGRVVSIGDECFRYNSVESSDRALAKVTLNEGLKTIGQNAFFNTTNLETINVPASVTSIGYQAFAFSGLKTVTFSERNGAELEFGKYVFYYNEGLKSIVLPEGLVSIPEGTFYSNSSLTAVTVPTTVRNINSERGVGTNAFYNCAKLADLVFTKGGTEDLSFAGGAFYGCDSITTLSLPNRVASLDSSKYDLFELGTNGVSGGKYNSLNSNVYAWTNSSYVGNENPVCNIENIEIEEGGKYFSSYNGVLYNADKSVLVWCPFAKKGNVEISKDATIIRKSAFYACKYVTSVTFEEGGDKPFEMADVTNSLSARGLYGELVFMGCYNLTSITFPARLTKLGNYSLYSATGMTSTIDGKKVDFYSNGLTEVKFAENCNLTEIGEGTFWNTGITEIELPKNVTKVGQNAFRDSALTKITLSAYIDSASLANITSTASSLKNVIVPADSETLKSDYDGQIIFSKDVSEIIYVAKEFETDLFTIPATINNIAANAFKDRTGIKAIAFEKKDGAGELTIGNYAFSGTGIASIKLPARIKEMGTYTFYKCGSLATVTFEEGFKYTAIPDYTFMGCSTLESITIPGEITSIGRSAFNGAAEKDTSGNVVSGLKSVTFGLTADGKQISQMTEILSDAFKDCYALSSLRLVVVDENGLVSYQENTLPYSVTTLGQAGTYYNGPFTNCISLKEITLPDGLTYVSKSMFSGCTSLTKVNLPSELQLIKQYAFQDTAITSLDFSSYDDHSLTIEDGAFDGATKLATLDLTKVGTLYLYHTFDNCTSLEEVTIDNTTKLNGKLGSTATYYYSGFSNASIKHVTIDQTVLSSMFKDCTGLIEVTLGENATEIKDDAFKGCTSLSKIDLSSVTKFGTSVFQNCSSLTSIGSLNSEITELTKSLFENSGLTSINLAETNVTTLGQNTFAGSALKEITIPASVTKIGSGAFANCTSLTKAEYLSTLVTLPGSLFSGCTNLTNVVIGDSVTTISSSAFANTPSLANVTLGTNVATLKSSAFAGAGLVEIDLNNVATVEAKVFENCARLKKVTINQDTIKFSSYAGDVFSGTSGVQFVVPEGSSLYADGGILYKGTTLLIDIDSRANVVVKDGTTAIDRCAFRYNTNVETVTLPESVTAIDGYFTFDGCTSLKSINLENVTSWKVSSSSVQDTFRNTAITELTIAATENKVFEEMHYLTKVKFVGEEVASAGTYAFQNDTALTTIEGNLVSIANYTFKGCTALQNLDDLQGLTKIGTNAFENSGLVSAVIPAGLTAISNSAFKGCTNLTSVTLHENVASIGTTAFQNCYKLVEIINHSSLNLVAGSTSYGYVATYALSIIDAAESEVENIDDYLFYADGGNNYLLGYVGNDTALTLPESYKGEKYELYAYAFYNNTKLTSVVGNGNITGIGDYAFSGCTSLTNVSGFDKITFIGARAFEKCPITSITIADTLQSIGDYAFSGCNEVITTEYDNALYLGNGNNLFEVLYKAKDKTIETCTINPATKFIASEAFANCTSLTSIAIPEGVVSIGAEAFSCVSKLESIEFASTVKTVGKKAFSSCSALASVTLNEGLTEIGDDAFLSCTSLTSIVVPQTVTKLGIEVFSTCSNLENATILGTLTTIPNRTFYNCSVLKTVSLQPGITAIGEYAFSSCKQLTKLDNLGKVETLGASAFYSCTSLTSLGDLSSLETINARAFYQCSALEELNVSEKLTYIGDNAFSYATSLKTLTLSGDITYVGSSAFQKWSASQTIAFTKLAAAPSTGWNKSWKSSCSAIVTWATASV